MSEKGVLYVAIGDDYIEQAKLSAEIIKTNTNLDIDITLITTRKVDSNYIDQIKPILNDNIETDDLIKKSKISSLLETPYKKTLYLDTDVYVISNINDIFDMLDTIDLALAIDPTEFGLRHLKRNPDDIPESFPEFQTGVISYQYSDAVQEFIKDWERYHHEMNIERDQISFRVAMFRNENKMNFSSLSLLYNHPVPLTQRVDGEVKIIHDTRNYLKTVREIDAYSQILNDSDKERIMFGTGYGPKKLYTPLSPKTNYICAFINKIFYFGDSVIKTIHSIRNEGLFNTIRKVYRKIRTSQDGGD